MKGFEMVDGDLVITNNELSMVADTALKVQTIQSVLSTNKGEWIFDPDEGINFRNILGKQGIETDNAAKVVYYREATSASGDDSELSKALEKRLSGE